MESSNATNSQIEETKTDVENMPTNMEVDKSKLSKGQLKKLKEKQKKERDAQLAKEAIERGEEPPKKATQKKIDAGERIPLRVIKEWPKDAHPYQTYDINGEPQVPMTKQYKQGEYPVGEIQEYE